MQERKGRCKTTKKVILKCGCINSINCGQRLKIGHRKFWRININGFWEAFKEQCRPPSVSSDVQHSAANLVDEIVCRGVKWAYRVSIAILCTHIGLDQDFTISMFHIVWSTIYENIIVRITVLCNWHCNGKGHYYRALFC